MTFLTDASIKNRLADGDLVVEPLEDEDQIQPASVDLRLDDLFGINGRVQEQDKLYLYPGQFVLGATLENVELDRCHIGLLAGRSSLARKGVAVHITAGFVDPGWQGQLTLELANFGPDPVSLYPGDRVCQIIFWEALGPVDRSYTEKDDAEYHDADGPKFSKIEG